MRKLVGIFLLALFLIAIAGIFYYPEFRYNIHTVIPHQVYRSAELPREKLTEFIQQHNPRSIMNLRGDIHSEDWHVAETELSKKYGIVLYNVTIPAFGCPTVMELRVLAEAIANAPRPLLVHCRVGADRSGLAAALALILQDNTSLDQINDQISWKYHVIRPSSVGKCVLPMYEKWLACHGLKSSKENFFSWVEGPTPFTPDTNCQMSNNVANLNK